MTVPSPTTIQVASRRSIIIGCFAALGAGICYGSAQFIVKKITGEVEPLVGAALSLISGTIILAALVGWKLPREPRAPRHAYVFVIFSGLTSAIGLLLMFLALSKAPVVKLAPFFGLQPLFAIILAQIFLKRLERLTWRLVIGATLVIGGVILVLVVG